MPFRLSFPLHFGAKKWRASGGAALEIRLALIVLLVRSDRLVSGNIRRKRGHSSCLALSLDCRKIIRFSPRVGFIGNTDPGGQLGAYVYAKSFFR